MVTDKQSSQVRSILLSEAILWLLGKIPHTEEEIAEHFGLSLVDVSKITGGLLKSGKIKFIRKKKKKLLLLQGTEKIS